MIFRSGTDPDSILLRRPLRERYSAGEPSPYEKIRDRVRDLLSSPRATRIVVSIMTSKVRLNIFICHLTQTVKSNTRGVALKRVTSVVA